MIAGSTRLACTIVLLVTALSAASSFAQLSPAVKQEKIEWTWADRSDPIDPHLRNILLLGDSITRAYFPEVVKRFVGKANVYLFATSCSSGDPRLPDQLRMYFQTAPSFSVIHFNNGMHGWDYDEKTFAAGLPNLLSSLREASPGSRLIWASITPVRKDNDSGATNARIDARNRAAFEIMRREGIPLDDQHALMEAHGDLHLDDVHFNEAGSTLQGDQAADSIASVLLKSK